jgi:hypothetical protein
MLSRKKNPTVYIPSDDDLDGPAAARALGISRRTLTRWCSEKPPRLTFTRIGTRKKLFRKQVIEYYLASQTIRGRYAVEGG